MAKKKFPINRVVGVYKITNIINNKVYVGSAFDINVRWCKHLNELKKNKHHSSKLQRAFNKYGLPNFKFDVIEACDKKVLLEREQYYLDLNNSFYSGYNCTLIVNHPMSGKFHSEETKNKMRKKHGPMSEETKKKLSDLNIGKKYDFNPEKNRKISEALIGKPSFMKGKERSKEFKEKHYKKINQFTKEGIFIKEWTSMSECAKILSIDNSSISKVCLGKLKSTKKFKFSYVN